MITFKQFMVESDDLRDYVGNPSVNARLRNGSKLNDGEHKQVSALDHMSGSLKQHKTLYRAYDSNHPDSARLDNMKVGDKFHDKGYMSTTHSHTALHKHVIGGMDEYGGEAKHILKINAEKAHGIDVNHHLGTKHHFANQREILLKRGTTLRKTGESFHDGIKVHHMEVES